KEEYDIWAMEMEHYLEYIDNDVWKVIQNGNSKKRISTGKDGVVRVLPPLEAHGAEVATKDETSGILQNFFRQIENQLNHRVKIIRSNNGTEFKNRDMLEFCVKRIARRIYLDCKKD
ncbi:retrovirus-related pol polyprotein from transposon TNT 1-94, partial [Tanacetum coccineum]